MEMLEKAFFLQPALFYTAVTIILPNFTILVQIFFFSSNFNPLFQALSHYF